MSEVDGLSAMLPVERQALSKLTSHMTGNGSAFH